MLKGCIPLLLTGQSQQKVITTKSDSFIGWIRLPSRAIICRKDRRVHCIVLFTNKKNNHLFCIWNESNNIQLRDRWPLRNEERFRPLFHRAAIKENVINTYNQQHRARKKYIINNNIWFGWKMKHNNFTILRLLFMFNIGDYFYCLLQLFYTSND